MAGTVLPIDVETRPVFSLPKAHIPPCPTPLPAPPRRRRQPLSLLWRHHVSLARVSPSLARDGRGGSCEPAAACGDNKGPSMRRHRRPRRIRHWPLRRWCTQRVRLPPLQMWPKALALDSMGKVPRLLILHSGCGLLCGPTLQQAVLPPSQQDHFAALRHPRMCAAARWAQLACCGSARNPGALLRVGACTNWPSGGGTGQLAGSVWAATAFACAQNRGALESSWEYGDDRDDLSGQPTIEPPFPSMKAGWALDGSPRTTTS